MPFDKFCLSAGISTVIVVGLMPFAKWNGQVEMVSCLAAAKAMFCLIWHLGSRLTKWWSPEVILDVSGIHKLYTFASNKPCHFILSSAFPNNNLNRLLQCIGELSGKWAC